MRPTIVECCSTCLETNNSEFKGACCYAGEVGTNYWCDCYEESIVYWMI